MTTPQAINGKEDILDSRDVIARIDELEITLQDMHANETTEGVTNLEFEEWLLAIRAASNPAYAHEANEGVEELQELRTLRDSASRSPDWEYGETLINRDYFVQYIEELIKDCYPMPKEMHQDSDKWPWKHMSIDYESAAEEAEQDYFEVTIFGHEYLIRA